MDIYILEEKEKLSEIVSYGLAMEREHVESFREFDRLLEKAEDKKPDLIILYEERGSSWSVSILGKLKSAKASKGVPVILIAESADEEEIVRGLDQGAELFITEPVSVVELHAYIHAVMRRINGEDGENKEIRNGKLRILPGRHQVFSGPREIDLLPNEFNILELLVENEGCVMDSHQIARSLKDKGIDIRPSTVKFRVNTLRKKIPQGEKLFHTIRGIGYKFENA